MSGGTKIGELVAVDNCIASKKVKPARMSNYLKS